MTMEELATEMYKELETVLVDANGINGTTRYLPRGLCISLNHKLATGTYALILKRANTVPSRKEMDICRKAFGVPAEAEDKVSPHQVSVIWKVKAK